MEYTDTTDDLQVRKRVTLNGPDNYNNWLRAIHNKLIAKDVFGVASGIEPYPVLSSMNFAETQQKWIRKDQLAWSIIDDTLDRPIHNILPPNLARVSLTVPLISTTDLTGTTTSTHVAHSLLLLDHLQEIYSAHRDIRRVELLRLIWRTDIEENEDPIPILSKMREAYSDLTANSTASSPDGDKDLAVAMIIALPPSYSNLAQTLLLRPTPADSASVITAVSDDVRRRATAESTNAALLAKRAIVQPNKAHTPPIPKKTGKYCSFHKSTTHSDAECKAQQQANIADTTRPSTGPASTSPASDKTGSTFYATTKTALYSSVGHNDLVIDSGCSTTVVRDQQLLSNIVELRPSVPIMVGNNQTIHATESGTLKFGSISLPALFVPSLARNLLSVPQTSTLGNWKFNKGSASFYLDDSNPNSAKLASNALISAKLVKGLYTMPSNGPYSTALVADTARSMLHGWHRRLGHLNVDDVIQMGKTGRLGEDGYWNGDQVRAHKDACQCSACITGGGTWLPTHLHIDRAAHPVSTTHVDLFRPTRTCGINGERYILTVYDDYTRRYHVTGLSDKTST